ncbi:hypothetical protein [Rhodococcus qingshengii]|uniref:hypothetical protein n=1 Tax=Rhodococcus qingshengii TaxID=334542 RepID=UPI00237D14C2|nr:hypothetical protein [Rhodococcus qingshengii]WCT06036.1 hypothetical protein PI247_29915 [Rhodococcus qingshengii]
MISFGSHRWRFLAQAALVVGAIVLGVVYLAPRLYDLVSTPYRLDATIVSADNYNRSLDTIVAHEYTTLDAFVVLDAMQRAIDDVTQVDGDMHEELVTLTASIDTDVRAILAQANTSVGNLVGELNQLSGRIRSLSATVDGAQTTLDRNTTRLGGVLADTLSTAANVHRIRLSADAAAGDLSGRPTKGPA